MATVDKDFRVKHGLVVEGTTATVNGEDIITTANTTDDITEGSTNLYFTNQRALDAVGGDISSAVSTAIDGLDTDDIEEGVTNLYFTDQRALDATSSAYDAAGAASAAQTAAESYADGLASNYDPAGSASAAQTAAEGYADSLAVNYDPAGAATTAETNANSYTDTQLLNYTATADLDTTVGGYGYLKSADLSGYATESYVGTAVSNAVDGLVDGAPGLLDTLNEIAAAINDDENYATTMTTALAGKQNSLTPGANIDITSDTISVTGLESTDISDFDTAALSATASAYDATGTASGLVNDVTDGTTAFTAVNVNSVAKQVAATQSVSTASTVTALSWAKSAYKSAKLVVKAKTASHSQVSEVVLTLDGSDNIAITEFGIVYTDGELATVSADVSGTDVRVRITTTGSSTDVSVFGTLIV